MYQNCRSFQLTLLYSFSIIFNPSRPLRSTSRSLQGKDISRIEYIHYFFNSVCVNSIIVCGTVNHASRHHERVRRTFFFENVTKHNDLKRLNVEIILLAKKKKKKK